MLNEHAPREVLSEGKYMRLIRRGTWEFAERNSALGAVAIVAVTPDQEIVLVEQYRVPVDSFVIELPAGLVGDVVGEPTDNWGLQAKRELLEETGFEAQRVKPLAKGPVSAGFGNEEVEFYLATGLKRVSQGGGVEHEQIRVHIVPLSRAPAWLKRQQRRGVQIDLKVYGGLFFANSLTTKPASRPKKPLKPSRSMPGRKRSARGT